MYLNSSAYYGTVTSLNAMFICLRLSLVAAYLSATLLGADAIDLKTSYEKFEFRVPMRDGIKLFTVVYAPKDKQEKYPFLMTRTPYSVAPYNLQAFSAYVGPSQKFVAEKFIFVMQDVRGRYESEGDFVDMPILKDQLGPKETDETTDTYDTIEWLLKNVPNNGKVGIYGISYDGFYTSCALVRSHPALVAASPQAPMADLFLGDDAYHNGALFLIANFSFYTGFPKQKNPLLPEKQPAFDYGTKDGYKFYLEMGSLINSDKQYLLNQNPYWTDLYTHTTYDSFWKPRSILSHLLNVKPAVLVVGGWFDAEDLSGTLKTFRAIERTSPTADLHLVMGPWSHGQWAGIDKDEKLGDIGFNSPTEKYFRDEIELPFFRYHLKGGPDPKLAKALVFETGKNTWQSSATWPPHPGVAARLYFHSKGGLNFNMPTEGTAFDSYDSDPNHPVPFYAQPTIEMTPDYMDSDQRFVANRKDVLTYVTDALTDDVTIAGPLSPNLFVSTTGTDSDFDVKLIDVYPDDAPGKLAGFQQLVRGEPFRGKFRNSFETPAAFTPGVIQKIRFSMPDVYHCFLKGHRLMVQVQSSWFPLTDRNPQTFVDIPNALPEQFITATEKIYRSRQSPSYIEVNVVTK